MKFTRLFMFLVFTVLSLLPLAAFAHNHHLVDELGEFVDDILDGFQQPKGYSFEVRRKDWKFSTEFEMTNKGMPIGMAVKTPLHLDVRTIYDLYNSEKGHLATGICRLRCLGIFYAWATEIDIYRPGEDDAFGYIDGKVGTFQNACFDIYENGEKVAIAYLDKNSGTFSFFDPETESRILVTFKRHFIVGEVDHWSVFVSDQCNISHEIIKMFATFALDTQNKFKADN